MSDIMVIPRLAGMALGCVIVMQFTWAIVRLVINSPDRSIVQHIAATLLNALRSGEPPDWALHGLQCQLRWPYPQRIRRCLKLLNHNEPLPLSQALITSKLFPVSESGHAAAATAGGQPLLLRWLADLAGAPPSRSGNVTATYLLLLLPMAAIFSFMMTAIAPKYEMIFKDIGAPLPAFSNIVFFGSRLIGNYGPILMPFFIVASMKRWQVYCSPAPAPDAAKSNLPQR